MMSFRALLAAAPLLALAVAQNIAFTSTPAEAVAGQSYNITWGGGDGTGATLTLRRGNPQDLHTVSTLADAVTTNYYVWTVPSSLETGDDYAFQITQGQSDINYSGLFSVSGGSASSSASSSVASSTDAATPTPFGNSTASITSMTGALGTGTASVRNSTFSSATLTSSTSGSTSNTHDFNDMSTTSSHSSATRTPSSASTSAPSNDASIRAGSSVAMILGIVAAVMLH